MTPASIIQIDCRASSGKTIRYRYGDGESNYVEVTPAGCIVFGAVRVYPTELGAFQEAFDLAVGNSVERYRDS